ncbi:hypothetical protein TUM17570_20640 [Enterobacter cloacae]|nr:hypothetical protein TUM17570_20640 [Enterobacter cloacae]
MIPMTIAIFFARAIRRTLTRQGKFAMLGSLSYSQSVHLTKKCEEADVFTKWIPLRPDTAPKVNYAAQMLSIC